MHCEATSLSISQHNHAMLAVDLLETAGAFNATDNSGILLNKTSIPEKLKIGSNDLTMTAIDGSGNVASCSLSVTLVDNVVPVLKYCPVEGIDVVSHDELVTVPFHISVFDHDNDTTVAYSHEPNSLFPQGTSLY